MKSDSGYIVIDYLLNLNQFYNNLQSQNYINTKHMDNLRMEGLYLDGYDYIQTDKKEAAQKNPACCEQDHCGSADCGCRSINGISGSVSKVISILER